MLLAQISMLLIGCFLGMNLEEDFNLIGALIPQRL